MTNKAKLIFADYTSNFIRPGNLRNAEMWKINAVEKFLESGASISKKGIRQYVSTLDLSGCRAPSEVEAVLLGLISPKITKKVAAKQSNGASAYTNILSREFDDSVKAFDKWLIQSQEFSPNTAKSYVHSARQYLMMFNNVSQKEAVEYKQHLLTTGLSRKTINLRLSGVTSYAKFLGKKIDLKRLRVPRALECNNVPSESEMITFLAKVDEINHYWYLIARCLSTTGLRVHELLKITFQDILNGSVILVGKGGKPRRVFFQRKLVEEVEDYLSYKNVLLDERICPKTARGVAQQIRAYSKKAGLDVSKFHPHAFRHYFAKQYLKKNPTDIVGLQNLLGHSSIETTSIYLQRSYEEQLKDFHKNVTWE